MLDRLRSLGASSYVRAVATLSSGQLLAALIPIAAAPVLGRLYHPADYGGLGLYMALASTIGSASTLQMHHAILSETTEPRAGKMAVVCMQVAFIVGLLTLAAVAAASASGTPALSFTGGWIWLLPISIFVSGATSAITMLANRRQRYGFIARNQVAAAAVTVVVSIFLGMLDWGASGLFVAYFAGQATAAALQINLLKQLSDRLQMVRASRWRALLTRHKAFAFYTMPSELIGNLNLSMPVYALTAIGTPADIGAFARARQLVGMPVALAGSSIAQVFRQRAAADYRAHGNCRAVFAKTFLALLAIGSVSTFLLALVAPDLFRIVLGPNWTSAGEVARLLAPVLCLQLVCSPLSTVFYFQNRQREDFLLNIFSLFVMAGSVAVAVLLGGTGYAVIVAYASAFSIIYIVYLTRSWQLAKAGDAA